MTRLLCAVFILFAGSAAFAQQRPLTTEDPETIGAGRVLAEAGFDYSRDVEYAASGLGGGLFRVPVIGISAGGSSLAATRVDGGCCHRDRAVRDRERVARPSA